MLQWIGWITAGHSENKESMKTKHCCFDGSSFTRIRTWTRETRCSWTYSMFRYLLLWCSDLLAGEGSGRHWLGLGLGLGLGLRLRGSWLSLLSCGWHAVPGAWLLGSSHVFACGAGWCLTWAAGHPEVVFYVASQTGTWWPVLSLSLPGFKALSRLTTSNALKLA